MYGALSPLIDEQILRGHNVSSCLLTGESEEQFIVKLKGMGHFDIYHTHIPHLSDIVVKNRTKFGKSAFIATRHAAVGVISEARFYNDQDAVTCVSESIAHELSTFKITPSKLKVVYNGLDTSKYHMDRAKAKQAIGILPDVISIGFSGRLNYVKNIDNIIKFTVPAIKSSGKKAKLYIMGRGRDEARLRYLVETRNIGDTVKFLGYAAQTDHIARVCAMDIAILYSLTEGCSISLLESMAAGSVPVVSDIPGNREVLKDLVSYAPLDNPPKLMALIAQTLKGNLDGRDIRKRCESDFSIKKIATDFDSVYHDALWKIR